MMRRVLAFSLAALCLTILATSPAMAQGQLKLPPYKKLKLKNGMTLLLMEQHEVPLVSFSLIVKAGSVADPQGKEGLASVTAALLRKGTKSRTADQISAELDFIGGTLNTVVGPDYTSGGAEFVKKDIAKGLDLLSDILLNAQFPQDELTKLIKQRIDGIKSIKDQPSNAIGNYFNAYLYGSHPYARPTGGDEQSLAAITRADVLKLYQDYYTPSNTILAVVGDLPVAEMERLLSDKFNLWPAKSAPSQTFPEPAPQNGKRLLLVDKPDSTQTFYRVGNIGIARTNRDRVYIDVVNTLFGGRFTSMLNSELRIKTGLTYGAGSFFDERKSRGPFVISTFTKNETTERAIDMTLEILKRFHEKGINEEELKSAKTYIKGQYPLEIETTDQLAGLIAELEFYGLDEGEVNDLYSKIDAMTVADAKRTIEEYYPKDNLVFVLIGKANDIQTIVKKYAPKVDTKSISEPGFQLKGN